MLDEKILHISILYWFLIDILCKIENTTPEKLEDQKKLVLSYSLIQEERFSGFKTWIENVEVGEKDLSMLDNAMNGLLK